MPIRHRGRVPLSFRLLVCLSHLFRFLFSVLFWRKRKKIRKKNNAHRLRFGVLLTPAAIIQLQPLSRGQEREATYKIHKLT